MNNQLSATSKIWVYQSSRKFTDAETQVINEKIKGFVNQWTAHKMEVTGDGALH